MADELYLIKGETLTGIGDAIRQVTGKTGTIKVENFKSEILNNVSSMPVYHTVTFWGFNQEVLATYQVKDGESVVYTGPTPISTNDLMFYEWNKATTNVKSDMIVTPVGYGTWWAQDYFTVEYKNYYPGYAVYDYTGNSTKMLIPTTDRAGNTIVGIECNFSVSLISVTIPPSCQNVAYSDFRNCTNLQDVYFLGSKSDWYSFIGRSALSAAYSSQFNFWIAPRIHTTDGCIINS